MPSKGNLMALGIPAGAAGQLGSDDTTSFVAAGASQGAAVSLTSNFFTFSTAPASTGGIIAFDGNGAGYNAGANTVKVYAPVGSYMNGSLNGSVSVPTTKSVVIIRSGLRNIGSVGA